MLGVNGETCVVAVVVCFSFLLITLWMKNEADNTSGMTKEILSNVSFSIDVANTILMILAFLVVIGVIIGVLSGGHKENENRPNKEYERVQVREIWAS